MCKLPSFYSLSFSAMPEICNISDHADYYIVQDIDCYVLHNIHIIHNVEQQSKDLINASINLKLCRCIDFKLGQLPQGIS